jgi:glycosyltransferase involved in cell wall biosynthesis
MMLFVGRLVGVKDLALWLDVAAEVDRACPGVRFVIAGDGPEKALLEAKARALGLRVSFPGAVDHRDLPALYAQASVFLLTSHYEGLGRVVVEAMLSGVPVVSVDIVGPRDLISDGETGRLVADRSATALSRAVVDVLTDREHAQRMADEALNQAERNFAFEAVAGRLADLWARVAARRS